MKKIEVFLKDRIIQVKFRDYESSMNILGEKKLEFYRGKIYGILCNHMESGWGLSYLLAGREKIDQEIVKFNSYVYKPGEKVREGWYVGEGIPRKYFFNFEKSVKSQIKYALQNGTSNLNVEEIIKLFELTDRRINCKFSHLSWESWRASAAIGYAFGKDIFCFPWLDSAYIKDMVRNTFFLYYTDILKNNDKICILPSADSILLNKLCDEVIEINDARFHNYKYFDEYINEYVKNKML